MAKLILFLAFVTVGLFGTTQSASFQVYFYSGGWGVLGTVYQASVQNSVSITSPDAAQIDSVTGTHLAGYNNDNVEVFQFTTGQIHYFPRGLNKIFKNIKGIQITGTGLKELHQNDLRVFPNLRQLSLSSTNLEILEAKLFDYNPNLELINLGTNKISHIDPNIFDKLTTLKTLYLNSNTCIDKYAYTPVELQNIVKIIKSNCINSDYSKLAQKVKNLEIESQNLNAEKLKEKLENLENEVKNSKFSNIFRDNFDRLIITHTLKSITLLHLI